MDFERTGTLENIKSAHPQAQKVDIIIGFL